MHRRDLITNSQKAAKAMSRKNRKPTARSQTWRIYCRLKVCLAVLSMGLATSLGYAQKTPTNDGRRLLSEQAGRVGLDFKLYRGYLIVVPGSVGGLNGLRFLVDTGAEHSIADRRLVENLRTSQQPMRMLFAGQAVNAWKTGLPDLKFGPLMPTSLDSWVLDLSVLVAITMPETLMSASNRSPKFNPPKSYYLALGDSFTYGFQQSKFLAGLPPSAYNTGYVDHFGARLRQIQPNITTVNYGCPGETTESFIHGPCPWSATGHELHDAFAGSQLDGAVAFLRAHPGEVSPITITLWGNDILEFLNNVCNLDPGCIQSGAPAVIVNISTNLAFILGQLRTAAPDAEIIVLGAWDGHIGAFSFADPLIDTLNVSLASAASAAQAPFANPFPTFNPQGDLNVETQTICTLTLACTDGDGHPSDVGYLALANVVFETSGYARLLDSGVDVP